MYIHQLKKWPNFFWDQHLLQKQLGEVRHRQGQLLGQMEVLGLSQKERALLETLTLDVTKSSEIEGEFLNTQQVRSSIARRLGIKIAGVMPNDRHVDGIVDMMLDATRKYKEPLTAERLFGWHAALFPTGRSGMVKITTGDWRKGEQGPMQVVSGPMGREVVHFEAPDALLMEKEMQNFLTWFNEDQLIDPVLKAAVAHVWFVTIHPFDDGNGRITRALTDMLLARADKTSQRYYSLSAEIMQQKEGYYSMLEKTQKGNLDITEWISWLLNCLYKAIDDTEATVAGVQKRVDFWNRYRDTQFNTRQRNMLEKLLDDFYGELSTGKWAKMNKCSTDTALRDILDLVEKGILQRKEGGGRSTNYALIA